jgi:type IV pilus assembly protein PilC
VYPIGVFIVISLAFFALLIFVVPQLETFLKNAGATIPWYTQPIIALSKVLKQSAFALFFLLSVAGVGVFTWWRLDTRSKLWFDGVKLKVWVIGPIIRQIAFARFSRTFSLLYRAGVPILECLGMLEGVLGNKVLSTGVSNIQIAIQGGVALTEAFRRSGLFSSLVLRMIHLGENTGQLDKTLHEVSELFARNSLCDCQFANFIGFCDVVGAGKFDFIYCGGDSLPCLG